MNALLHKLKPRQPAWLLLRWDVSGLWAVVCDQAPGTDFQPTAHSSRLDFAQALDDVLQQLADHPIRPPYRVAMAARQLIPTVLTELPVLPDQPRRSEQMTALLQADLEPVLADFGGLWSIGSLLQARGFISAAQRDEIALEEAIRRQQRATPLRYGEIAMEMGLIERSALNTCLDIQSSLQNIDEHIVAGWHGRLLGKQPLWLACGVSQTLYEGWCAALAQRRLKLVALFPLVWLASAAPLDAPALEEDHAGEPVADERIDVELHREEILAIHRRHGQIIASRSSGRGERGPSADQLQALIADWLETATPTLAIHCLQVEDEQTAAQLAEQLGLTTVHDCRVIPAAASESALWQQLRAAAQAGHAAGQLVGIMPAALRARWWRNQDVHRLLALVAVVLILGGMEVAQRRQLSALEEQVHSQLTSEKSRLETSQLLAQANTSQQQLAKELEQSRRTLEPLLHDRSRLESIVAMRRNLPELMFQLAQAVGHDAVIEELHNDGSRSQVPAIQVKAWAASYTGAQAFVNRMSELARPQGFVVSQMEIEERRSSRDQRKGHEVRFWLLTATNELEADAEPATAPTPATAPAAAISAPAAVPAAAASSGPVSAHATPATEQPR